MQISMPAFFILSMAFLFELIFVLRNEEVKVVIRKPITIALLVGCLQELFYFLNLVWRGTNSIIGHEVLVAMPLKTVSHALYIIFHDNFSTLIFASWCAQPAIPLLKSSS